MVLDRIDNAVTSDPVYKVGLALCCVSLLFVAGRSSVKCTGVCNS